MGLWACLAAAKRDASPCWREGRGADIAIVVGGVCGGSCDETSDAGGKTSNGERGATLKPSKQSKTKPSESGLITECPLDLRPITGATATLAGEGGGEPPGRTDLEPIPPPWGRAPAVIHALGRVDLSILFMHAPLPREERQSGSGPGVRAAEVGGDARAVEPPR